MMMFQTTEVQVVPEVGSPITYTGKDGREVTVPMPDIRVCNLQNELDNVKIGHSIYFIFLHGFKN